MTTADKIAAAHATTPTCNAAASDPFHCHSLMCRTKAFGGHRQPVPAAKVSGFAIRAALVDLLARAMAKETTEAKLGTLEGGIESILIRFGGMTSDEVAAIAGGVR